MPKVKSFSEFLREDVYPQQNQLSSQEPVQPQNQQQEQLPQLQTPQEQPVKVDLNKVRKTIDFSYLNKDSNMEKVKKVCEEAKRPENLPYIFGVVVRPEFVSETKKYLEDTDIKTISIISYPNGDEQNSIKLKAIQKAVSDGAEEINVVMNFKKLYDAMVETDKDKQIKTFENLQSDIRALVEYCKERSVNIKVVIEMEALKDVKTITKAVEICKKANVDFITTSTDMYADKTNYNFEQKIKDITEVILPLIQGTGDININVCGGINTGDKLMKALSIDKVTRITTSTNPQMLINQSQSQPQYQQNQDTQHPIMPQTQIQPQPITQ